MSTVFYAFKPPVTSIRVSPIHENRVDVNVWIKGQLTGHLICKPNEVDDIVAMFYDEEEWVAQTYFAGLSEGMAIRTFQRGYEGYITDGRRVTTLKDLEAMVEASRKAHREIYEETQKEMEQNHE